MNVRVGSPNVSQDQTVAPLPAARAPLYCAGGVGAGSLGDDAGVVKFVATYRCPYCKKWIRTIYGQFNIAMPLHSGEDLDLERQYACHGISLPMPADGLGQQH